MGIVNSVSIPKVMFFFFVLNKGQVLDGFPTTKIQALCEYLGILV